MKAPDKLVFDEARFSDIGIFGIEDETEYIRRDAILDWLDRREDVCLERFEKAKSQEIKDIYVGEITQIDCIRAMLYTL